MSPISQDGVKVLHVMSQPSGQSGKGFSRGRGSLGSQRFELAKAINRFFAPIEIALLGMFLALISPIGEDVA
jgi:hypothetical protein